MEAVLINEKLEISAQDTQGNATFFTIKTLPNSVYKIWGTASVIGTNGNHVAANSAFYSLAIQTDKDNIPKTIGGAPNFSNRNFVGWLRETGSHGLVTLKCGDKNYSMKQIFNGWYTCITL